MKVLFAVSNENISETIIKRYQKDYKEIISYKNVYYFNAILKEIQRDKSYDRIVISEDLEPFANNDYDAIDKFLFEKLDNISDEATSTQGENIPIVLICSDRRAKSEQLLVKLFGIGIYDAIIGADRSIEQVCQLIRKPRTKKEAKIYYKIESDDVNYQVESEDSVSEVEIQNILMHYKKLGKDEEAYVNSFNNIASQYTDTQLKLIIKFLPLNVKAVLEVNSPKYQSLMAFAGPAAQHQATNAQKQEKKEKLKINFIENQLNKDKEIKQVVVPSAVNTANVKKVGRKIERPTPMQGQQVLKQTMSSVPEQDSEESGILPGLEPEVEEPIQTTLISDVKQQEPQQEAAQTPRRRGRPKKIVEEAPQELEEQPKRKRGRPKKVVGTSEAEEVKQVVNNKKEQEDDLISMLPGLEEEEEEVTSLPGFETEEQEDTVLPGIDEELDSIQIGQPSRVENDNRQNENFWNTPKTAPQPPEPEPDPIQSIQQPEYDNNMQYNNYNSSANQVETINREVKNVNIENLITRDKKVVAFVGTSKNGTSFIVNNLAQIFSDMGIKTAILDTTQNKNSYYIYTKNEEELRNIAYNCMEKLTHGVAEGIKVTKNLTVYTSLPTLKKEEDTEAILSNLVKNYSLVLIDCDFNTPLEYFQAAQEVYLVQSMDILTIQPLTSFLRELKAKGILQQEKFKIIINKVLRVKSLDAKLIIGGVSYYNDPSMSIIIQLFDKDKMKSLVLPFDQDAYAKYLDGLVECRISVNGYSKNFIAEFKKLANSVYPLLDKKYVPRKAFSDNMDNTLEQMKRRY